MPAKVKVRILAGRNLPVMDKSSDASDAFVEVKLGNTTYKTEVYRRSLNPFWNSEWFRFEVSDQELQDEPLQIRIMDYDTYSANDAIGKVYINLNPLLLNPGRSMNGWLPIYDTLHGIRGEINCMVKVNLFADNNRFRHSSCGVRFFFSDIPNGYKCDAVLGFVDELLVNDDPEYQWIDKIRTPRASNEARQTLFTKLSGEVQRKLGLKAEIFGGNAVIGYQQSFDLEGGSGIVGRGIGTAVVLSRIEHPDYILNYSAGVDPEGAGHPYQIPQLSSAIAADRSLYSSSHGGYREARSVHPDRHLVHSVSADYFYEVPNKVPSKKLSDAHESLTATAAARHTNQSEDTSEVETFVSLKSQDDDDDDDDDDDADDSTDDDVLALESSGDEIVLKPPSKRLVKRGHLTKSMSYMNASELLKKSRLPTGGGAGESSSRRLSRLYIGQYLRHQTQELNQKLLDLTKPVAVAIAAETPAAKLIKLIKSGRTSNRATTRNQSHLEEGTISKKHRSAGTTSPSHGHHRHHQQEQQQQQHLQQHKSLSSQSQSSESYNNSSSTSANASIGSTPATVIETRGSVKRRKDKAGQAAQSSLEDTLSIIEEKFDDDAAAAGEHQPQAAQQLLHPDASSGSTQMRSRVTSAGSQRMRQFTRSKEIDLSGDLSESSALTSTVSPASRAGSRSKGPSATSSADDNEELDQDDPDVAQMSSETLSDSTRPQAAASVDGRKSPSPYDESLLSTSSPSSASVLTDETIKPAKVKGAQAPLGLEVQAGSSFSLRKSDTDLVNAQPSVKTKLRDHEVATGQSKSMEVGAGSAGASGSQLGRSESSRHQPPKRSITISQDLAAAATAASLSLARSGKLQKRGANFAQSVGVVKAQQHLLQNMIKHQNQNLVVSSMNKAKSALVYPGRIHQSEYPFVTLKRYPGGLIQCTGGVVSVHSVKLLDHIINDEESETRDNWWTEIRREIRSHAKSLNCNTILGYTETSKVLGDVCVLSARGTAAILKPLEQMIAAAPTSVSGMRERTNSGSGNPQNHYQQQQALKVPRLSTSPQPHVSSHASMPPPIAPSPVGPSVTSETSKHGEGAPNRSDSCEPAAATPLIDCSFCHTPLHCVESIATLADCSICCSNKVPDVLLLTIEPPKSLNIVSTCSLVQARVCRTKRDSHGEASAKEIGEALPFLEYELHRQLFSKLKFKGMNCLFNLEIDISVGENFITGIATGTGCFVLGLPTPDAPMISAGKGIKATKLNEIQRLIALSAARNRDLLGLSNITQQLEEYHKQLGIFECVSPVSPMEGETGQQQMHESSTDQSSKSTQLAAVAAAASSQDTASTVGDIAPCVDNERGKKLAATAIQQATYYQNKHKHHKHHHHHHNHGHNHGHYHGHHNHGRHHHHHYHHKKSPRLGSRYHGGKEGAVAQPTENLVNMLGDENNIVLEVDDNEDADIIALLIDSDTPQGYMICNSEIVPTIRQETINSINMFTQVMRIKLNGSDQFAQQFDLILQTLYVKLRRSLPCCLTNLNFVVDLPESNVVQITVTGCLLGLVSPSLVADQELEPPGGRVANLLASGGEQTIHSVSSAPGRIAEIDQRGSQTSKSKKKSKKSAPPSSTSMSPTSTTSAASTSTSVTSTTSSSSGDKAKTSSSSSDSLSSSSSDSSSNNSTVSLDAANKRKLAAVAVKDETPLPAANREAAKKTKPPGKSSSGSNLAALINVGKSTFTGVRRSKSKNADLEMEMTEQLSCNPPSTKSTIAAVKQEILLNKLGRPDQQGQESISKKTARKLRPVFKKQQTYPGANSPAISGQDNVLAAVQQQQQALNEPSPGGGGGSTTSPSASAAATSAGQSIARKQATALLNRVKQPFKDLGSNFNSAGGGAQLAVAATSSMSRSSSMEMSPMSGGGLLQERGQPPKRSSRTSSGLMSSRPSGPDTTSQLGSADTSTSTIKLQPAGGGNQRRSSLNATTCPSGGQYLASATAIDRHSKPSSLNSSIDITSLSYIPGAKDYHYLGNLSFSFVRETNSVRENGGLNGFIHCFLMEVYAIVRAHVSALGGNAFLSFRLQQSCIFYHSNKNQAQCLISVAGDAVQVTL